MWNVIESESGIGFRCEDFGIIVVDVRYGIGLWIVVSLGCIVGEYLFVVRIYRYD